MHYFQTFGAMVMAGPRVLQAAGEDLPGLHSLAVRTRAGSPLRAIVLQQMLNQEHGAANCNTVLPKCTYAN